MKLRAVTLNTWGLPFPLATHPRWLRFPRISRFLQDNGFDFAALQEVWHGAPSLGLAEWIAPERHHGDSGLAVSTRMPVLEIAHRAFRAARGLDAWKRKGFLLTRLQLARTEVVAVSTHLQAGASARNADVRARQVDELLAGLADHREPCVILGDFNLHHDSPVDAATAARLHAAGWRDDAPHEPTYVWGADRFDRIFVRAGAHHGWVRTSDPVEDYGTGPRNIPFLSDHRPVEATLSLVPTRA